MAAENKQRSPGRGHKSEKQREAAAQTSMEEAQAAASTEFGNDVKEIRSFTSDDDEPVVQKIRPQPSGSTSTHDSFSGEWEEDPEQKSVPEMLSDRMDDLKGYAGHLVNGAFDRLKDEWKYNRKGLIRKAAVTAVVTSAAIALAVALKNRRSHAYA